MGGPAGTTFNVTHAYDPAGNRTTQADGPTITIYSYSPANRLTLADAGGTLTTYAYDAAGNRTAEQPQGGPSTLYAWDAAGRMVAADTALCISPAPFIAPARASANWTAAIDD